MITNTLQFIYSSVSGCLSYPWAFAVINDIARSTLVLFLFYAHLRYLSGTVRDEKISTNVFHFSRNIQLLFVINYAHLYPNLRYLFLITCLSAQPLVMLFCIAFGPTNLHLWPLFSASLFMLLCMLLLSPSLALPSLHLWSCLLSISGLICIICSAFLHLCQYLAALVLIIPDTLVSRKWNHPFPLSFPNYSVLEFLKQVFLLTWAT